MPRSGRTCARVGARALVALATCSLLAGCAGLAGLAGGSDAPTSAPLTVPPGSSSADADGSAVVLRVEQLGGFVRPQDLVTRLPDLTVLADGRAVREVPMLTTAVEDLPAVPPTVQRTLTPAGLDALVERVRAAGVGDGADLGEPTIMDAATTRFLLVTDDGRASSDAYALEESAGLGVPIGEPEPSPSISVGSGRGDGTFTREQADARYRLLDLVAALDDLPATLGADAVGQEVPYVPEAVAAVATPWVEQSAPDPIAWPGPALPGAEIGGVPCVVARGEQAGALLALDAARLRTPWTDGGRTWSVRFRPLLPDEHTCADLAPEG